MRKIAAILTLMLAAGQANAGGEHLRERVYLSTDKDVYIAGDDIWYSALCVDLGAGAPSTFSSVAYIEIHSTDGMVQTGKVALDGGRGAGRLTIPTTVPTGNYKIMAYTAQSFNETGYDYAQDAKLVSIFNTLSTDRVEAGVKIVDEEEYAARRPASASVAGDIAIKAPEASFRMSSVPVLLTNNSGEAVTVSLSVFHDDGIVSPEGGADMSSFLSHVKNPAPAAGFTRSRVPDYEGEVIRARVAGTSEVISGLEGKVAFLSAPGTDRDVYSSLISADGTVDFYTSNIYGDKDIFLEIEGLEKDQICHLELLNQFANAPAGDIPALEMSSSIASSLLARSTGMQISKVFDADTLYSLLPLKEHHFYDEDHMRYNLDEYTRFPLMEEVFIEFVYQLRVRTIQGRKTVMMLMNDSYNAPYFSDGNVLMMLDGVPVLDSDKILSYDPALIHYLDLYPYTYQLGPRFFSGVVNFVTYKGNLPTMQFQDNVRIVSFQGTSYPQAFTCQDVDETYPDYRQTILWHPSITLEPGQTVELQCKTPAYGGRFNLVVEGVTASLEAVNSSAVMQVR